ncbi:unnamed protein product [Paramecium pentaurelia]|uniref:Uncharacterized protein n=1 Tax=Paramecium pentaurelia TaxID=43138 RepID=A0A8S1YI22_9CILI|nr:unnamed protein product [Paramecium pentaurelia]
MEEDLLLMKNKVIFSENYHYVVLLDYSGSMSEDRFNRAQMKQFHFYHQHNRIRISSCHHNLQRQSQMCDMQTINNVVVCNGASTSFQSAFQVAYEKIRLQVTFINIIGIQDFFYTDEDSYPTQALAQFARMPFSQRMKIDLIFVVLINNKRQ